MSNFTENAIVYCDGYKTYGDLKYHTNFPDEWITDELPGTGRECFNCVGEDMKTGYAMWRGIVLGYCANCAMEYEGERGPGFYAHGVEVHLDNAISAYDVYIDHSELECLGDPEANPNDTMEKHHLMRIELSQNENENENENYDYEEDECYPPTCIEIYCEDPTEYCSRYCVFHNDFRLEKSKEKQKQKQKQRNR